MNDNILFNVNYKQQYKTTDADEYKKFLRSLNLVDLQRESIRVNIVPSSDRNATVLRLMKEFKRVTSNLLSSMKEQNIERPSDEDKKERALKVMDVLK